MCGPWEDDGGCHGGDSAQPWHGDLEPQQARDAGQADAFVVLCNQTSFCWKEAIISGGKKHFGFWFSHLW